MLFLDFKIKSERKHLKVHFFSIFTGLHAAEYAGMAQKTAILQQYCESETLKSGRYDNF
jgi:hypothetical protein